MKNALEGSKIFPLVAWVLIISFALLTYTLTVSLQKNFQGLDESTTTTVDALEDKR